MSTYDWPAGLSAWESQIYRHISEHVTSEAGIMNEYLKLAEETDSAHVRYLINLIAEEEQRHHRLYEEWMNQLRAGIELREVGPAVPPLRRESDPKAVLEATDKFLEIEQNDLKELKELYKDIKDVRGFALWPLIVELMQFDTQKHIKILEFLKDHAKRTAKSA